MTFRNSPANASRILSLFALAVAACSGSANLGNDNTGAVGGTTMSPGGATSTGGTKAAGGSAVTLIGGSTASGGASVATGGRVVTPTGGSIGVGGVTATGGATSTTNCGTLTCNPSTELCYETYWGANSTLNTYSCNPLPTSCGTNPACTCISGASCSCSQASSGLITTVCLVPAGSGGATSAGGSTSTGGATSAGGSTSTGGATSTGGSTSTGGAISTGGSTSTGGATGTDPIAQSCQDSGGTVTTAQCCSSLTADFPNSCLGGVCGCSPDSSKTVRVCQCPSPLCFNGQACVSQ